LTKLTNTAPPKVLPQKMDAEQALLAAIFRDNKVLQKITEITTDDFYREAHGIIYEAMLTLFEDGETVDLVTVCDYLQKDGNLEKIGGVDYLASMLEAYSTSAGAGSYARMIKDCAIKRYVINECHQLAEIAYQDNSDTETLKRDIYSFAVSIKDTTPRRGKLSVEVNNWVQEQNGHFLLTEIYKSIGIFDKVDKINTSQILSRMVKDGKVERFGGKSGCFRRADDEAEVIDWKSDNGEPLDIRYPLGIERFFNTMSKNVILLAGAPDAGKTAMLLNFVYLNMTRHKVWYFSSEMGAMELKSRIEQFDDVPLEDWNFEARERAENFSDVIRPDDINVIDYLEISDNFYQVGQKLTDIYKRLDKGMAIVALQKDPKATVGRGKDFGLEKPRLYLTVDTNYPDGAICRIVKAKNWRDPKINPNGYFHKFKIVQGCKLIATSWEVEYE